ncbi:MAG: NUDIX hydrolase [Lachnospiraceae bacterium]|nr:NUDIX hydrolase [Lachnospiraceae bacterium]
MRKVDRVREVTRQTENRFLNLYEFQAERRNGKVAPYFVASRAESEEQLKARTEEMHPDGVIIYGVYGEKKDRLVLIKQFRYPINDYVYEFPAGLVEPGEDMFEGAKREMFEETGLEFTPRKNHGAYSKPYFTSTGMTDECCGTVYGYCSGIPSNLHQEDSEDIEVVLADREECKRILKEEKVAIKCAYMLMHFIHCKEEDPLAFLEEL